MAKRKYRPVFPISNGMRRLFLILCFSVSFGVFLLKTASAATISVSPSSGTFTIESTINVLVYLDTEGESINAFDLVLRFPSDKLQIISPSTGPSIVGVWTGNPRYDNVRGTIELRGGIPGGITTSNGLIASFLFRAKSVGTATIKPETQSKVLLNDGLATDVLRDFKSAVLDLRLPPPQGPIVASETHPDELKWYPSDDVILRWSPGVEVEGYSYVLNQDPIIIPDNTSEGLGNSVAYQNVQNGRNYFHIKSLSKGAWGGVTHFSVKIDGEPPAEFPINIIPSNKTVQRRPAIEFSTTDGFSGINYYDLKIIPLSLSKSLDDSNNGDPRSFFIEAESPYISPLLELGSYDVLVRAHDRAGNIRELSKRLIITTAFLRVIGNQGVEIRQRLIIPWVWIWIILAVLIAAFGFLGWRAKLWHREIHDRHVKKDLPPEIQRQLEELKNYRAKYKKLGMFLLVIASAAMFWGKGALAAEISLPPPLITSIPQSISNEDIFYLGGRTRALSDSVIIYIQNIFTGEVVTESALPDEKGDWFYRHQTFLPSGEYLLWVQAQKGEEVSPPSPQEKITVERTALQFGSTRLSYATIYTFVIVAMLAVLGILIGYIVFHGTKARRKQKAFLEELKKTEEALERGFAVLERDILSELAIIKKTRLSKDLTEEEKRREMEIMRDIEAVRKYIGKEIWEIEEAERHPVH